MCGVLLRLLIMVVVAGGVFAPVPAPAHPHVWITTVTTFALDGKLLTAVRMRWQFDGMFSAVLAADFDKDRDGAFSPAETEVMTAVLSENLGAAHFFTDIVVGDDTLHVGKAGDMAVHVENGRVVLEFNLPLPEPVDPAIQAVSVSVHDDSYYIAFAPDDGDPVRIAGGTGDCRFDMTMAQAQSETWGAYNLPRMALVCTAG